MEVTLIIIALVAGIIGLIGVIVPVLPGTLLSYAGLVCMYFVEGSTITTTQMVVCGIISVIVVAIDFFLPGYFTKLFGGSKSGVNGATVGTIVGMFFGLPGIILGPFVGAVIGEMAGAKSEFDKALSVGLGSLLSFLVGSGIKLIVGVYIMYQIVKVFIQVTF